MGRSSGGAMPGSIRTSGIGSTTNNDNNSSAGHEGGVKATSSGGTFDFESQPKDKKLSKFRGIFRRASQPDGLKDGRGATATSPLKKKAMSREMPKEPTEVKRVVKKPTPVTNPMPVTKPMPVLEEEKKISVEHPNVREEPN